VWSAAPHRVLHDTGTEMRARDRAVALIDARGGPLGQDWSQWRAEQGWPLPVLPERAGVLE
jgi:hypothetical protein